MLQVEECVLDIELELFKIHDVLATFDAIVSLATVAKENNFVRPVNTIYCIGVRFYLQTYIGNGGRSTCYNNKEWKTSFAGITIML